MANILPVGLLGLGIHVPERILTNHDLEQMVETSDEWILTRTGIRERHICREDETTSMLATEASRRALEDARLDPNQLDMIICCTITPDHFCPSTACLVQAGLGIKRPIPAFDLSAACSGFIYGCSVAVGMIRAGTCRHVLVIGAETMSRVVDFKDRNTCVLFGDGAGAVVLGRVEPEKGLLGESISADGSGAELILVPGGLDSRPSNNGTPFEHKYLWMNGNEVYKFATRIFGTAIQEALAAMGNGIKVQDLDLIIPHQANHRIIEVAARKLEMPPERFVINIDKYGNTSAASIPLAMADARTDGRLKSGTLFSLVAFGGGLTYAASIWRW